MTPLPRLAYDDLPTLAQMRTDARRAGTALGLPSPLDRAMLADRARRWDASARGTTKGPR